MKSNLTSKITKLFAGATMVATIAVALSFFIPIVPCTKSANIAAPVFKPGLCSLPNPFITKSTEILTKYYWTNPEPLAGALLQFILAVIIFILIASGMKKKKGKVLDLTNIK